MSECCGLLDIAAASAALRTGTGQGVKVAILDSGVEVGHPALAGLTLVDDLVVAPRAMGLVVEQGGGVDVFGHGTAIAGILRSVAPAAQLGSIRILGENLGSRTEIIREGVRVALERGYHVLNCSFGCGVSSQVLLYKRWVDEAYLGGVHIVAACNNYDVSKAEWPGAFSSAITVNMAACQDPLSLYYRPGRLVEFAARGAEIDVLWKGGGVKRVTGSSYAAPHVAAMLARLLSVYPTLSPPATKAVLRELAVPWTATISADNEVATHPSQNSAD